MSLEKIVAFMESRGFVGETVHIDTNYLPPDQLKASIAWVESLGVDSKHVRAVIALVHHDGEWELHLSQYRLRDGHHWLDVAHNDAVSEPLVIPLGAAPSLPDFAVEALA